MLMIWTPPDNVTLNVYHLGAAEILPHANIVVSRWVAFPWPCDEASEEHPPTNQQGKSFEDALEEEIIWQISGKVPKNYTQ